MANNLMEMFAPRQVYTPTDAMRDVGQAQNALASGQLTSMKANALGQEMADDEAINQVMSANGGDLNSAMQDPNLNWKAKQQIGGMISEQNKAQADSQMKRVESQIKNWQYAGNRVGSAQSQEDWDAAREEVRSVLGDDFAKNLPEQWSPEVAQKLGDAAMTHAEKIALQKEERNAMHQDRMYYQGERRLQNAENGGGDKWSYSKELGGMVNNQGVMRPVVDQSGNPIPKQESTGIGKEQFGFANTLRDEYNQQTKDFVEVQTQAERLKKYVESPSAAGDQAIIFAAMKANDPTSTVRESEFALAASAGGYGEQIQSAMSKVQNGQMLTPAQRKDFLETAKRGYEVQKSNYSQVKNTYEGLAKDAGLDPRLVVSERQRDVFGENAPAQPPANAPTTTNW